MAAEDEPNSKKARTVGSLAVGWFRNDLRIRDNPMLADVMEMAKSNSLPAMLVYIMDPRFYDRVAYGRVTDMKYEKSIATRKGGKEDLKMVSRKCNGRRARFYLNILRDLKRCLAEVGTELHIFYGKPEEVFADLSAQYGALDVVCLREQVSPEWTDVENFVEEAVKAKGGSLKRIWGAMSLFNEDDLPWALKQSPGNYSGLAYKLGWADIWTSGDQVKDDWKTPIRSPLPAPEAPWPCQKAASPKGALSGELIDDDKAALTQLGFSAEEVEVTLKAPHGGSRKGKGGETAAWARFNAWMEKKGEAEKKDPNFVALGGGFGAGGASFLVEGEVDAFQWKNLSQHNGWLAISKYMAPGCISPREMYHTVLKKQHWALPGMCHRFMWREWHRLNAIKWHRKLAWLQGPGKQNQPWREGEAGVELGEKWKTGQMGIPYMDAVMRELNQTGWIAYVDRKSVACFLAHDLWVDWRLGAFHMEEMLLDYDFAMNYGNWVFCARVDKDYGHSFREADHKSAVERIVSVSKSDPEGAYVRQWVPELRSVPAKYLHAPWKMSAEEMETAKCVIGKDYPKPCLDMVIPEE